MLKPIDRYVCDGCKDTLSEDDEHYLAYVEVCGRVWLHPGPDNRRTALFPQDIDTIKDVHLCLPCYIKKMREVIGAVEGM